MWYVESRLFVLRLLLEKYVMNKISPDSVFQRVKLSQMTMLLQKKNQGISSGLSKGDVVKEAHCAILSLFVESARLDLQPGSLSVFLATKVNWSQTRCTLLADAYLSCVSTIQALLSNIGMHPPHIVDVHWSLNHNTKSSSNDHTASSLVSVDLETEGLLHGQEKRIMNFMCTLPELQDLVTKLKEAQRQVEHVAHLGNA